MGWRRTFDTGLRLDGLGDLDIEQCASSLVADDVEGLVDGTAELLWLSHILRPGSACLGDLAEVRRGSKARQWHSVGSRRGSIGIEPLHGVADGAPGTVVKDDNEHRKTQGFGDLVTGSRVREHVAAIPHGRHTEPVGLRELGAKRGGEGPAETARMWLLEPGSVVPARKRSKLGAEFGEDRAVQAL